MLIVLAYTGRTSSTNQPALPSLVIILNDVRNIQWKPEDPETLTAELMASVKSLVEDDKRLLKLAKQLDPKRQTIKTTEDFLMVYFSSIKAFPVYGLGSTGKTSKVYSRVPEIQGDGFARTLPGSKKPGRSTGVNSTLTNSPF